MSRLAELLTAIGGALRNLRDAQDKRIFTEVRVELDRYDLSDLLKDSTKAPTARVCFMRGKPVKNTDSGFDLDVSVAIVVVAGREGRPNSEFSSADLAALNLLDLCSAEILRDPYVGLGKLQEADLGDQLVALAEQSSDKGMAIALMEAKWRLLDVQIGRPALQAAIGTGRVADPERELSINGGPAEAPPIGYVPPEPTP